MGSHFIESKITWLWQFWNLSVHADGSASLEQPILMEDVHLLPFSPFEHSGNIFENKQGTWFD